MAAEHDDQTIILLLYVSAMTTFTEVVGTLQRHKNDNGSPEVQIALLCASITNLQQHLQKNHHDVDSKRSLLRKVAKRRTFMKYLKSSSLETYQRVAEMYKLKA